MQLFVNLNICKLLVVALAIIYYVALMNNASVHFHKNAGLSNSMTKQPNQVHDLYRQSVVY